MYKSNESSNLQSYTNLIDKRILQRIAQVPIQTTHNQHQSNVSIEISFDENNSQQHHVPIKKRAEPQTTFIQHHINSKNNQPDTLLTNGTIRKIKDNYQFLPGLSTIPQDKKTNGSELVKTRNEFDNKSSNIKLENTNTAKKRNDGFRIFTGTAEKIIKWHKIYKDYFCYYEIIGAVVAIEEGSIRLQKIMLLRDKVGPILQVIHYANDYINIEDFFVGQMLRCVGRMVGPNIMHGLSIREAKSDEVSALQRMCYICDHAIKPQKYV